jgi:hypothetical protein
LLRHFQGYRFPEITIIRKIGTGGVKEDGRIKPIREGTPGWAFLGNERRSAFAFPGV